MSKTIKSLLFIVIGVAFASSFVANNATLDGETLNYVVNAMDSSFPVPTNLYNISVALASILNYTALLVIINVINATNKNTEITQGTLDNKQNVSLSNEALIMETLDFLLEESLYVQNEERRDALQEDIKLRIPLTVKLSNTHIDFKSQDVQSQISGQEAVIEQLKLALTTAIKTGNLSQEKILNTTIAGAEKFLITLRKKQV